MRYAAGSKRRIMRDQNRNAQYANYVHQFENPRYEQPWHGNRLTQKQRYRLDVTDLPADSVEKLAYTLAISAMLFSVLTMFP